MFTFRRLYSTLPLPVPGDIPGLIQFLVHRDTRNMKVFVGLLGTAVAIGCVISEVRHVSIKLDEVKSDVKSLEIKMDTRIQSLEDKLGERMQSFENKISSKFDNQWTTLFTLLIANSNDKLNSPPQNKGDVSSSGKSDN